MSSSPETTGSIDCPECSLSFDTREELARHSRQQHAIIKEGAETRRSHEVKEKAEMPSIKERVQTRSEEKGKGEVRPEDTMQKQSGNDHACKDCGECFENLNDLTIHYRKAHPESL